MARLKSCGSCGKIHSTAIECKESKVKYRRERTEADRLRGLQIWKKKREHIRKRDNHMCQICYRGLHGTITKLNYKAKIQVHHIESMEDREDLWLEDSNLITLCSMHHELAEKGQINKQELKWIVQEQENK